MIWVQLSSQISQEGFELVPDFRRSTIDGTVLVQPFNFFFGLSDSTPLAFRLEPKTLDCLFVTTTGRSVLCRFFLQLIPAINEIVQLFLGPFQFFQQFWIRIVSLFSQSFQD